MKHKVYMYPQQHIFDRSHSRLSRKKTAPIPLCILLVYLQSVLAAAPRWLLLHTRSCMYLFGGPGRFLCMSLCRLHILLRFLLLLQLRYRLQYSERWCSKLHQQNSSTCCCSRSRKRNFCPSSTKIPSRACHPLEMVPH